MYINIYLCIVFVDIGETLEWGVFALVRTRTTADAAAANSKRFTERKEKKNFIFQFDERSLKYCTIFARRTVVHYNRLFARVNT